MNTVGPDRPAGNDCAELYMEHEVILVRESRWGHSYTGFYFFWKMYVTGKRIMFVCFSNLRVRIITQTNK